MAITMTIIAIIINGPGTDFAASAALKAASALVLKTNTPAIIGAR